MTIGASGTEGYSENAESLVMAWRNLSFEEVHRPIVHLLPTIPSNVLDIGAGIGTDAAALAAMGHNVVAVEPVDEFRAAGMELHQSQKIEWLDDSLPELVIVRSTKVTFGLVMLTAVWMHLDEDERRRAMPNVCSLLGDGGPLIMSLRHGPIPPGRACLMSRRRRRSGSFVVRVYCQYWRREPNLRNKRIVTTVSAGRG